MALEDAKRLAAERFPPAESDWDLVISRYKRRSINDRRQRQAARGKDTVAIPAGSDPGFNCFAGTRLMGANNCHRDIINGGLYVVIALIPLRLSDEESGAEFLLSPEQIAKHTRLRWACTYPSVQGRTLQGTVALWGLSSQHFTSRHLYIGLSRATHGSLVQVNE